MLFYNTEIKTIGDKVDMWIENADLQYLLL